MLCYALMTHKPSTFSKNLLRVVYDSLYVHKFVIPLVLVAYTKFLMSLSEMNVRKPLLEVIKTTSALVTLSKLLQVFCGTLTCKQVPQILQIMQCLSQQILA